MKMPDKEKSDTIDFGYAPKKAKSQKNDLPSTNSSESKANAKHSPKPPSKK